MVVVRTTRLRPSIAYSVTVQFDMLTDGVIGLEGGGQYKPDFVLLKDIRCAVTLAGFRTAVRNKSVPERRPVVM